MLSFSNPLMLFGLAGLLLPLVAHFIHHELTKKKIFSSIRHINASKIPREKQSALSDIILMLLRMLLMASLLLAIADPVWVDEYPEPVDTSHETIIMLDLSASMSGWKSRDKSIELAFSALDREKGAIGLITYGLKAITVIPPRLNRKKISDAIKQTQGTLQKGNPQLAIENAIKLFKTTTKQKKIVIISDFQATDWQNVSMNLSRNNIRVELKDTRASKDVNIVVTNVTTIPVGKNEIRVSIYLNNQSGKSQTKTLILTSGEKKWEQEVNLNPLQISQAMFQIPGKYMNGYVHIAEDDTYQPDNEYFFSIQRPPAIKAKIILSSFDSKESEEESFFIQTALLSTGENRWQPFTVETKNEMEFDQDKDSNMAVIFLPGLSRNMDPLFLKELKDYLKKGGIVFVSFGDHMTETLSELKNGELINAQYKGLKKKEFFLEPYRIGWINPESTISKIFSGDIKKDLILAGIKQYIKLEFHKDVSILMKTDNNDPLIARKEVGKGQLILTSVRFNTVWSDLPIRNSFLPILKELILEHIEKPEWPNLEIGDSFEMSGETFYAEKTGLFKFRDSFIGVNVSRNESVQETISAEILKESLGSRHQTKNSKKISQKPWEKKKGESLWMWFALFGVFLFIVENMMC